ncbi:hypothetical protein ASPZODRAFT_134624 [Penicilliopsis zonata CBS 506.65]|uniref:Rhodopsin domain-containing protein n=1 Tax=Penicilliopsis zonata CBS 506.65 TaxID=1073090 RepID=A0A1L9SBI6_9EURO|nr:hypothetical protein ASPZODRAFT_134624 [Penicilliopsis zonata CBS 506.65]OJJ44542.1 hypothetical protein ASPZODRAFT_134624 [Penicilliopsis zonata CBS 506.65]
MGNESPSPHQLLIEAIIFWSIGIVLYIGRMVSRIIASGSIKQLFLDDYIMTFTFMIYTILLVLIQVSARYATNLMDPADYERVLSDPEEVKDRIYGSKVVIGLEQCMLFSTWGVKTCLLILYWRMTKNLRMNFYVKILAAYVALGFFVVMLTYYAVYCRPFSQYWAMPVSNIQCATYRNYSITQAVFNISSDAAMLAIPIPLLTKAQIKLRKKALLICIMSLGVFTIAAAIMNKYFNFASPLTTTYQIWYIREASTAIYVANMMCWWPLLRKVFGLKAFQYGSRQHRPHHLPWPGHNAQVVRVPSGSVESRQSSSFRRLKQFNLSRHFCGQFDDSTGMAGKDMERRLSEEAINKPTIESIAERQTIELESWEGIPRHQQEESYDKTKTSCLETITEPDSEKGTYYTIISSRRESRC